MPHRLLLAGLALVPLLALAPTDSPSAAGSAEPPQSLASPLVSLHAAESTHAEDCQFSIRARNNLSFDVWVELYDSTVRLDSWAVPALFRKNRQLKIQNHRIASGKTMDRRYTAPGACGARRNWTFWTRHGGREKLTMVSRRTEGTGWRDRVVDLGESSKWGR